MGSRPPSLFNVAKTRAATLVMIGVSVLNRSIHSSSVHSLRCSTQFTPKAKSFDVISSLQGRELPRNHRHTADMSACSFDIDRKRATLIWPPYGLRVWWHRQSIKNAKMRRRGAKIIKNDKYAVMVLIFRERKPIHTRPP